MIKGDNMTNLDKDTEEKILEIVEKYQKENTKLLNYLITDEDLEKVAEILNGSYIGKELVNQEYRFKFKMGI